MMNLTSYLEHERILKDAYREIKYLSLDDIHHDVNSRWNNDVFENYYYDIARSRQTIHDYADHKLYLEYVLLSGDIKYNLAMLYFLRDHISSDATVFHRGNIVDRRFMMHLNNGYQSIYQFWDRIGDQIWCYFETGISPDRVYTGRVLENIKREYKLSLTFNKLKVLFESHKETLSKRDRIVHSYTITNELIEMTNLAWKSTEGQTNFYQKLDYYHDVLEQKGIECIEALFLALELISILPNKDL